jgi:hypothetical protein
MAALANADRLEWVGHGRTVSRDERRGYGWHQPFKAGWQRCVMQRPLALARWSSPTGQLQTVVVGTRKRSFGRAVAPG